MYLSIYIYETYSFEFEKKKHKHTPLERKKQQQQQWFLMCNVKFVSAVIQFRQYNYWARTKCW